VFANRRINSPDRRTRRRGGRRLTDLIGLDAAARVASPREPDDMAPVGHVQAVTQ
jgi:hypothetical protein